MFYNSVTSRTSEVFQFNLSCDVTKPKVVFLKAVIVIWFMSSWLNSNKSPDLDVSHDLLQLFKHKQILDTTCPSFSL